MAKKVKKRKAGKKAKAKIQPHRKAPGGRTAKKAVKKTVRKASKKTSKKTAGKTAKKTSRAGNDTVYLSAIAGPTKDLVRATLLKRTR